MSRFWIGWLVLLVAVAAVLASCATRPVEPRIVTQIVKVPVSVPCAADPGPDPRYADTPDALKAAANLFERVKLLVAGRAQRDARLTELKAASAGCRAP